MKVVSIVGARPNFVKLAGVEPHIDEIAEHVVIHTGQHYDFELSRVFFKHFDIREPDYYLDVGSGTHGYQTGEMIKRIEEALLREKPDIVIVYGDTNSTLAGALAAVKAGFPVAHVEAGLRSFDPRMPEEINRRITDHISTLLFAPTYTAVDNLLRENVIGEVYLTGDIHVDVLNRWLPIALDKSRVIGDLGLEKENYIVATVHRAENTDNLGRLSRIVEALVEASKFYRVVIPLHPRTRKALEKHGLADKLYSGGDVLVTKPLGYIDFIKLMYYSRLVITDSGGVQREAYLMGKKSLVLRDRTEWVELVRAGWVRLVDVNVDDIVASVTNPDWRVSGEKDLLGDGRTGERIKFILTKFIDRHK